MGVVGVPVLGLTRDTAVVLLDRSPNDDDLPEEIPIAIETETDRIADLHVWQVGLGHHAAIISIVSGKASPLSQSGSE